MSWENFIDLPKIGICRGAQFLNVKSGGAMWQDVNNHTKDHVATDILFTNTELTVSSTHHQMMIPSPDGEILAFAKEATQFKSASDRDPTRVDAEVVWYEKTKSLCFQPHPELAGYSDCRDYFFDLIDYLIPA